MTDRSTSPAAPFVPGRAFLHRELILVLLLSACGVVGFLLTKGLAESNAALRREDATVWFARGRDALARGDVTSAVSALRRASRIDPANREMAFALAGALRSSGETGQAAEVLASLREARPDDAEANTELARLENSRGNFDVAVRYYQDALNALWMPEAVDQRRALRTELIHAMLEHGQRGRALAQTLVLAVDLPPAAPAQIDAGRLFLAAGDPRRALDRFSAAVSAEPSNKAALAGAGEASFALGDYAAARRNLTAAGVTDPRLVDMRDTASLVLSADPLAARLGRAERERRIDLVLQHADARLDACAPATGDADAARASLRRDVTSARDAGATHAARTEDVRDRAEETLELALRVEQATAACGTPDAFDRAMTLMARAHGLEGTR